MKDNFKYFLLLIHYWFPVALGWSIALVIQKATDLPLFASGFYLYLLAIFAAYNLDRIIDNDDATRPPWLIIALISACLFSTITGLIIALQLSIQTFSALLVFSIITLFYKQAKKLPLLKGVLVAVVWVWAGVALPFINTNWFAWQFWTLHISLPIVMLMACGVVLCDFKDIKSDTQHGVRSLPVIWGLRKTTLIISALLFISALIAYHENRIGLVVSGAALLALAQFPRLLSLDAIGPLVVDVSLTIPGLLIALHLI
ncbi:MAG: UbiA family prenyltransferase [Anaerolineales bacterium]|nr:UbiA family prenyltransferase [Anaerolineales bacterium]